MKLSQLFIVLLVIAGSCKTSKESVSTLHWSDEFNYSGAPDTTKWGYDLGGHGWGNNELQLYTSNLRNARVENGNLIIEAHKDSGTYTSARLISKGKGDWKYGRIEVRAKLPKGRGTWPAIWMLSTDWKYGGWPESGEIDIMEHVGYDPGVIHATAHSQSYNHVKGTQIENTIKVPDAQEEFHLYALEWSENKMDFFVDDNLYHTVPRNPKDDFKGWPFDQRFYLLLNMAVGGNWGGKNGVDESIWPQRMEVDYVRVYE